MFQLSTDVLITPIDLESIPEELTFSDAEANDSLDFYKCEIIHDLNNLLCIILNNWNYIKDNFVICDSSLCELDLKILNVNECVKYWLENGISSVEIVSMIVDIFLIKSLLSECCFGLVSDEDYDDLFVPILNSLDIFVYILENCNAFESINFDVKMESFNLADESYKLKSIFVNENLEFDFIAKSDLNFLGSKVYFLRALINLLDNAFKILKANNIVNPKVVLRMEKIGEKLIITVSDNGNGIGDKSIADLICRGYTDYGSKGPKGFGIGLAVVDRVVRMHNGSLDVCNNSDGGATFSLVF